MRAQGVRHDVVAANPHLRGTEHQAVVRTSDGDRGKSQEIQEFLGGIELQLLKLLRDMAGPAVVSYDLLVEAFLIRRIGGCTVHPTGYRKVGDLCWGTA